MIKVVESVNDYVTCRNVVPLTMRDEFFGPRCNTVVPTVTKTAPMRCPRCGAKV